MSDQLSASSKRELTDTERLHQLGYAQELNRTMSKFSIFAISFTISSILSGCLTPYKWGPVLGWTAIVWAVVICIILILPQTGGKFSWTMFNYAPVAVAAVLGSAGMWHAVSARKWLKGPTIHVSAEELAAIERELSIYLDRGPVRSRRRLFSSRGVTLTSR